MNQDTYSMTPSGFDALKDELQELETIKRPQAMERIRNARAFCDFNEDYEYEAALHALASMEKRIATIQYKLQHAQIIPKLHNNFVEVGNTVTIQDITASTAETYTIVDPEEADPNKDKISYHAPISQALLYAKVNETVSFTSPNGEKKVKVLAIM